jgi:hypothetical protein
MLAFKHKRQHDAAQELKKAAEVHAAPFRPAAPKAEAPKVSMSKQKADSKIDRRMEQAQRRQEKAKAGADKRAKEYEVMLSGVHKQPMPAEAPAAATETESK